MELFDKFKKKENQELQQDLSGKKVRPGSPFLMYLLMAEKCDTPDRQTMLTVLEKHIGSVECFAYHREMAGFAPKNYTAEFKDGKKVPPQLLVLDCAKIEGWQPDPLTRSQFWDCPDSEEILARCKYHVIANDMLGGGIPNYKDRANLLMDFMEALMELYPTCEAVLFKSSGKLFARRDLVNHNIPRDSRFIKFAVNVRFFNITGSEDKIVDTLGMSILYLPDLQYHFRNMEPNWVVNHAYDLLSYQYHNNAPIKNGDTIDGITDGSLNQSIQWKCHFEDALIQPPRMVLDVCMDEYAAGTRES